MKFAGNLASVGCQVEQDGCWDPRSFEKCCFMFKPSPVKATQFVAPVPPEEVF